MATAILDIELTRLPASFPGLEHYTKAQVLVRYNAIPLTVKTMAVHQGRIDLDELVNDVYQENSERLTSIWIDQQLALVFPPNAVSLEDVTVAICTRDRTDDLEKCLRSLVGLTERGQEILVVDNAPSNDDTRKLVASFARVRYIREELPGLDTARNTAVREARGSIIAFIDDDAVADSNWLEALAKNFEHPMVMCVTGLTLPAELETPAQEAFESYSPFSKGFWRKVYKGETMQHFSAGHIGAGANMAIRKEVFSIAGPFDEALDAGTVTQSGGDHEYFLRILLNGYHIVYEPAALNWHRHRKTSGDLYKAIKGYGTGIYATWTGMILKGEWNVALQAYSWLLNNQLPGIAGSVLRRQHSRSLRLQLLEWYGCILGPWAYLYSRFIIKNRKKNG